MYGVGPSEGYSRMNTGAGTDTCDDPSFSSLPGSIDVPVLACLLQNAILIRAFLCRRPYLLDLLAVTMPRIRNPDKLLKNAERIFDASRYNFISFSHANKSFTFEYVSNRAQSCSDTTINSSFGKKKIILLYYSVDNKILVSLRQWTVFIK